MREDQLDLLQQLSDSLQRMLELLRSPKVAELEEEIHLQARITAELANQGLPSSEHPTRVFKAAGVLGHRARVAARVIKHSRDTVNALHAAEVSARDFYRITPGGSR